MGRNTDAVAFLGLGSMGSGMAHRLLDTGFTLTVHNRTAAKAAPLMAAGAQRAASAALAVDGARTVVLSLSDETAIEQVLFGELAGRLRAGTVVVDTSTISPAYSRSACGRLGRSGVRQPGHGLHAEARLQHAPRRADRRPS